MLLMMLVARIDFIDPGGPAMSVMLLVLKSISSSPNTGNGYGSSLPDSIPRLADRLRVSNYSSSSSAISFSSSVQSQQQMQP